MRGTAAHHRRRTDAPLREPGAPCVIEATMTHPPATPPELSAPDTPGPPRGMRRWRTWLILASISVGWKVLVFTLGAALPRWLISDGIADRPEARRVYAAEAADIARTLWRGPIERHGVVRMVRVMSVDSLPGADSACGHLSARVRAYTYFAIPYSEVRTVCDRGTVEYRVFRRKHRSAG